MIFDLIIDVVLLSVFFCTAYYGYKKGLFKMILEPFRTVICFVVSFSLCDRVAKDIISPVIAPTVRNYIAQKLLQNSHGQIIDLKGIFTHDGRMLDSVILLISQVFAFVLCYLLTGLILKLVIAFLGLLAERGILGGINSLLGMFLSCCIGFAVIWLLASVIDYSLHLDALVNSSFAKEFGGGVIYRWLRELNPIRLILSRGLS